MKLAGLITAAAGVTIVLASPTPHDLGDGVTLTPRRSGVERRRANRGNGVPIVSNTTEHVSAESVESHVEYDTNWAGAVLVGSGYKTVTGTFTVPTPQVPSGGSTKTAYVVSAWVGIDGDTCQSAIWQAGVDSTVQNGVVSYGTWYEWYPQDSYYYSGFSVSAGNSIQVTVTATSTTSGSVTIENLSTGKSVSSTVSGLPSSEKLCETNAEWIIEALDPVQDFASFGTITFTNAYATTSSGTEVGPSGSVIFDIEQSNKVLTSCSASSSSVACSYV